MREFPKFPTVAKAVRMGRAPLSPFLQIAKWSIPSEPAKGSRFQKFLSPGALLDRNESNSSLIAERLKYSRNFSRISMTTRNVDELT